jgi:hypothetical protein
MFDLRQDVINFSKTMLAQIPFNTVLSYADTLFDKKEKPVNIDDELLFLNSTPLSDIAYSNETNAEFFTMTNINTNASIQVSNRPSTQGELRGKILRDLIDERKKTNPQETVYDTITRAIKMPEHSDVVGLLRSFFVVDSQKKYPLPMSEEHFKDFTSKCLDAVQKKIDAKQLSSGLTLEQINEDIENIWEGIDVADIFDSTMPKNTFDFTSSQTSLENVDEDIQTLQGRALINLSNLRASFSSSADALEKIDQQIKKIESLKKVTIPGQTLEYYSIADSAGGVTEKTCLIDKNTLSKKLEGLAQVNEYSQFLKYKISMNAILKHPKHGNVTEVQREAIGLKIAKILGFEHVTENTMVNHKTQKGLEPCLFVPFGHMEELGQAMNDAKTRGNGRLLTAKSSNVEDFGKYSAYFALCSDPDFIGKVGQNKGLTTQQTNPQKLYVFDQVFMPTRFLKLNSAFNLVPSNLLAKGPNFIARHFVGRNKSIINDASYEEKISGAMNLLNKKNDIDNMFRQIEATHKSKDDPVSKTLYKDAKECKKIFNARVRNIEKLFPSVKVGQQLTPISKLDKDNQDILKKAMLVNVLINKPKLYDKNGKSYREPFISSASTRVKGVEIDGDNVKISFSRGFGTVLSKNKRKMLEAQGFEISPDGKSATIKRENLPSSLYKQDEKATDKKEVTSTQAQKDVQDGVLFNELKVMDKKKERSLKDMGFITDSGNLKIDAQDLLARVDWTMHERNMSLVKQRLEQEGFKFTSELTGEHNTPELFATISREKLENLTFLKHDLYVDKDTNYFTKEKIKSLAYNYGVKLNPRQIDQLYQATGRAGITHLLEKWGIKHKGFGEHIKECHRLGMQKSILQPFITEPKKSKHREALFTAFKNQFKEVTLAHGQLNEPKGSSESLGLGAGRPSPS